MIALSDKRLPALDGVRGIAILMVMVFHFWGTPFGLMSSTSDQTVDVWAHRLVGVGWSGVDLFFVLSGFLITGILYDAKSGRGYFRSFYARRTLRIVPAYYAFLVFVLLIVPLIGGGFEQVAQPERLREIQFWFWTYLVNVAAAVKPLDVTLPLVYTPFWSLAVEEQFYLVWPLVVLAFGRRTLMGLCVILAVAALVFRFALTEGFASDFFAPSAASLLMPARMDTLVLGGLVALALRGDDEMRVLARIAPFAALIAGVVLVALFARNDGLRMFYPSVQVLGYSALAVLGVSFLVFSLQAVPGSLLYRGLTLPILRTFGRYSYAMYVVHLLLSFEVARRLIVNGWTPAPAGYHLPLNVLFTATCTVMTLGVAWVSWRVIERPFLRLKDRFTVDRRMEVRGSDEGQPAGAIGS